MIRVVLDTNVLISAALKGGLPQAVVRYVTQAPDCEWVASPSILREYREVLARPKFHLTPSEILTWHTLLERVTTLVVPDQTIPWKRDPKDARFLECALAASADYLVSGDQDLHAAHSQIATQILSPQAFHQQVVQKQ